MSAASSTICLAASAYSFARSDWFGTARAERSSSSTFGFLYQADAFHVPWNWLSYIVPIQFSGSMKYADTQWIHMSGVLSGFAVDAVMFGHVSVTSFTLRPIFLRSDWKSCAACFVW